MTEVITVIENHFGIEIKMADPHLGSCTFSGVFYQVDNVELLLQTIDTALNISHQRVNTSSYLLSGTGC
jgi:ferric-dicitrate binding protein FerR (iron transport regulator)